MDGIVNAHQPAARKPHSKFHKGWMPVAIVLAVVGVFLGFFNQSPPLAEYRKDAANIFIVEGDLHAETTGRGRNTDTRIGLTSSDGERIWFDCLAYRAICPKDPNFRTPGWKSEIVHVRVEVVRTGMSYWPSNIVSDSRTLLDQNESAQLFEQHRGLGNILFMFVFAIAAILAMMSVEFNSDSNDSESG